MFVYCAVLGLLCCSFYTVDANPSSKQKLFDAFRKKYSRTYAKGSAEYHIRYQNFLQSLKRHRLLNRGATENYGINQFSDLTKQEFRGMFLQQARPAYSPGVRNSVFAANVSSLVPQRLDWRSQGVVTAVKNQKSCGGCWSVIFNIFWRWYSQPMTKFCPRILLLHSAWAFSLVEVVESMFAIEYGSKNLTEISVQQVIDCVESENKCKGGDSCSAARWLKKNEVLLVREKAYPLTDTSQTCKCQSMREMTDIVQQVARHGPVAVAVDASLWMDYIGGIVRHHCPPSLNHAAVIVGYDFTSNPPHYIVRNSWGPDFGLEGYLKIGIGKNVCGVAEEILSVDVSR